MLRFLLFAGVLSSSSIALATPVAKTTSAIDARAVNAFEKAIKAYKKFRSLSFGAEEFRPNSEKSIFASGSLQWPYRAKLDIVGAKPISQGLVGREKALFWDGTKLTETSLKTQAQREQQIMLLFQQSPALALGPVSLRAGINPARTPLVRSASFARLAWENIAPPLNGINPFYHRIFLTRTTEEPNRPLKLTYYFDEKGGMLERLEIERKIDGKVHQTRTEFDPLHFGENFIQDQEGTDRYVYDWKRIPDAKPKP